MIILSERLKELISLERVSRKALAASIGVDRKSVSNWLKGDFYPSCYALVKLANYFGISIDYLLGLNANAATTDYNIYDEHETSLLFCERIVDYIGKHGVSRYMLAKKLKIGQTTLARWFKNEAMPDIDVLLRLSNLMGESVDYLLGRI